MCKKRFSGQTPVNVLTTDTEFCAANPKRVALVVSCPITNRITISAENPAVDLRGIVIPPNNTPVCLHVSEYGDWICRNLHAIANVGAELVTFLDVQGDGEGNSYGEA